MDLFDISEGYCSLNEAFSNIKCPIMIMGAQTDILFPVRQQRDLANWLKKSGNNSVTYFEMDSLYGFSIFNIRFH
jgi:homoserine acetyltransferase